MTGVSKTEEGTQFDPDLLEEYEIAHRKTLAGRLETLQEAIDDLICCVSVEVLKLLKRLGIK